MLFYKPYSDNVVISSPSKIVEYFPNRTMCYDSQSGHWWPFLVLRSKISFSPLPVDDEAVKALIKYSPNRCFSAGLRF